jgi:hypothetical protein
MNSKTLIAPEQVQVDAPPNLFMVFDVESIGLHGEGFAVGYVVVNCAGETLEEADMSCSPFSARGEPKNLRWVQENVPTMAYEYFSPHELREAFWQVWMRWKALGAVLVADCCWPVEARFLAACIDDGGGAREWEGPYPLHDLASFLLAHGKDPLAANERLPRELPAHHPLNDARQSARLLLANLAVGGGLQVQPDRAMLLELQKEFEVSTHFCEVCGAADDLKTFDCASMLRRYLALPAAVETAQPRQEAPSTNAGVASGSQDQPKGGA